MGDNWGLGDAYEPYVGRWSRVVAREFLEWLDVPAKASWLDVGCGTGALSEAILGQCAPAAVTGVDPSDGFVAHATRHVGDAHFMVGDAQELPFPENMFDAVVSGLVLNFVPKPPVAVAEMARVARPDSTVAAYVWDYADMMQLMRVFWDAAVALDPAAQDKDEGVRFPLCKPEPLRALFSDAGLGDVDVRPIDAPTVFRDFDDYWTPFLGGQAPAPAYAMSLNEERRVELRERVRAALPIEADGSIRLVARAWAVKGRTAENLLH